MWQCKNILKTFKYILHWLKTSQKRIAFSKNLNKIHGLKSKSKNFARPASRPAEGIHVHRAVVGHPPDGSRNGDSFWTDSGGTLPHLGRCTCFLIYFYINFWPFFIKFWTETMKFGHFFWKIAQTLPFFTFLRKNEQTLLIIDPSAHRSTPRGPRPCTRMAERMDVTRSLAWPTPSQGPKSCVKHCTTIKFIVFLF